MFGLPHTAFQVPLSLVPEEHSADPGALVLDCEARVRVTDPKWIDDRYGDEHAPNGTDWFSWRLCQYDVSWNVITRTFSPDDIARLWFSSPVMSDLTRGFEESYQHLWKVQNSHWQYGVEMQYNKWVEHVAALGAFDFGLPDFETTITHTRGANEAGMSVHEYKLYLDGVFGIVVWYKGEHVLTIGLSLAPHGVLVSQVQLRQKKGNRFLYKLPKHYLDWCLERLAVAFNGTPLWLVEGSSAVSAVRLAYGKQPCTMTPEDEGRIGTLYNRPLDRFSRADETRKHFSRTYVRLDHKNTVSAAA